ncbi:MAG: phage portal protein [Selenomonadaceae bacterium]|nr:phage portal protein [Selenomonadaceae bacterium]
MKILDFFKGLFRSRDKPQDSYHFSAAPFLFGKSISGATVNEMTAMRCSAVYACVRILAESVAALPLHVYEYTDKGKERAIKHPLYFLLHDAPNDEMTSFNFREVMMTHLLLHGNCYAQILKNNGGRVIGLYPLMPNRMSVERDDDGQIIYRYTPTKGEAQIKDSATVIYQRQEILHIPALGFDGMIGYSPIAMARNAIGVAIACEEFGAKFFENGARPSGILEHPGIIKNTDKLREEWQKIYGGSQKTGRVAILEEGMKYQSISIPPNDAQFLDTRKFQLNEIARIFRVPPHMLADLERATFSNIEHQSLEFVMYSLMPWLARWEQNLSKALFTPSERGKYFVKFNVDGLMRGDYQSRMQGYSIGRQNGWLSANDIREMEDLNPISEADGGNYYLVNGNFTKLKDAGAAYEKAGDNNE